MEATDWVKSIHKKAFNKNMAWGMADKIFPTDYEKDETKSAGAGYNVYRHYKLNPDCWISDLGTRLEINIGNTTINIWIDENYHQFVTEWAGL